MILNRRFMTWQDTPQGGGGAGEPTGGTTPEPVDYKKLYEDMSANFKAQVDDITNKFEQKSKAFNDYIEKTEAEKKQQKLETLPDEEKVNYQLKEKDEVNTKLASENEELKQHIKKSNISNAIYEKLTTVEVNETVPKDFIKSYILQNYNLDYDFEREMVVGEINGKAKTFDQIFEEVKKQFKPQFTPTTKGFSDIKKREEKNTRQNNQGQSESYTEKFNAKLARRLGMT